MSCIRSIAAAGVAFLTPQHSFAHIHMSCSWERPRATAASCELHVCECVWVGSLCSPHSSTCVCVLYSFSCALAHFRSADTETDTEAGSEFWCISGEAVAAPRLMVERAREEFMFNLRKIMIIFYFMVERTTTSSFYFVFFSFTLSYIHIFREFSWTNWTPRSSAYDCTVSCYRTIIGRHKLQLPEASLVNWWATIHYVPENRQQQTTGPTPTKRFKLWLGGRGDWRTSTWVNILEGLWRWWRFDSAVDWHSCQVMHFLGAAGDYKSWF